MTVFQLICCYFDFGLIGRYGQFYPIVPPPLPPPPPPTPSSPPPSPPHGHRHLLLMNVCLGPNKI